MIGSPLRLLSAVLYFSKGFNNNTINIDRAVHGTAFIALLFDYF